MTKFFSYLKLIESKEKAGSSLLKVKDKVETSWPFLCHDLRFKISKRLERSQALPS